MPQNWTMRGQVQHARLRPEPQDTESWPDVSFSQLPVESSQQPGLGYSGGQVTPAMSWQRAAAGLTCMPITMASMAAASSICGTSTIWCQPCMAGNCIISYSKCRLLSYAI